MRGSKLHLLYEPYNEFVKGMREGKRTVYNPISRNKVSRSMQKIPERPQKVSEGISIINHRRISPTKQANRKVMISRCENSVASSSMNASYNSP